jgi:hypothetical protein
MEPNYVIILDFCTGSLNIIELTAEELKAAEVYEDFESFLYTIEEKYGFSVNNCNWMVAENLDIYCYKSGKEVSHAELGVGNV